MPVNVGLSFLHVESAKRYGALGNRFVADQIEYWSRIGKTVSENPDLLLGMITQVQTADHEEAKTNIILVHQSIDDLFFGLIEN